MDGNQDIVPDRALPELESSLIAILRATQKITEAAAAIAEQSEQVVRTSQAAAALQVEGIRKVMEASVLLKKVPAHRFSPHAGPDRDPPAAVSGLAERPIALASSILPSVALRLWMPVGLVALVAVICGVALGIDLMTRSNPSAARTSDGFLMQAPPPRPPAPTDRIPDNYLAPDQR